MARAGTFSGIAHPFGGTGLNYDQQYGINFGGSAGGTTAPGAPAPQPAPSPGQIPTPAPPPVTIPKIPGVTLGQPFGGAFGGNILGDAWTGMTNLFGTMTGQTPSSTPTGVFKPRTTFSSWLGNLSSGTSTSSLDLLKQVFKV